MKITKTNDGMFGFRVAGLIIRNNKILLQRADIDEFWVLPGGSIQFFETFEDALKREFMEEMSISIKIERLIWILENFFEYNNEKIHSLEIYFLVSPLDCEKKINSKEFYGLEEHFYPEKYGKLKLFFKWFTIDELDFIDLRPKILKKELKSIPNFPKHIQNIDK